MTSPTEHQLGSARPGRLGQVAAILYLVAGVSGILSAFTQEDPQFTGTFWLRLLMGVGFLLSGILQFVARRKKSQIFDAPGGGSGS